MDFGVKYIWYTFLSNWTMSNSTLSLDEDDELSVDEADDDVSFNCLITNSKLFIFSLRTSTKNDC